MKEQIIKYDFIVSSRPKKQIAVIYDPCPPKEKQEEYERLWKRLCDSSRARRLKREKL